MIKKFLQKIFKIISYGFFLRLYGRIDQSIKFDSDSRIKFKVINIEKNLKYKVYKIAGGRLYTDRIHDTGIILDNKIIEEPSFQLRYKSGSRIYNSKISDNVIFTKGTPRVLKNLNGVALSLLTGGGGNNNYWHWIFDVMPRLSLAGQYVNLQDIDFFLFPSLLREFQKETLDHFNIPINKRLSSEKFRHIKAKELIVTDHPILITGDATYDIQNIPIWIIKWLKSSFINLEEKNNEKNNIYINRKNSKHDSATDRSIKNEDEIEKFLLKNNFISINLNNLKFSQQVNLFHNANCIVGLHGAGFANTVFCKEKTKVIEFRSTNAGPVIENLAKKNDLNYHSIISEPEKISEYNYPNQQGSINIPIDSLKKILQN